MSSERAIADVSRFGADPSERRPVTGGWIARYGLLYLGQNISWAAPTQLLLAQQILVWHPGEKEQKLALLMAIGGFFMLIGHPLAGWLSDRTNTRWGRRSPWILFGGLAAAAALLMLGAAPGFATLAIGWSIFQLALAASINATQAVAPDTVPQNQYGLVSGVLGLTYTLGVVLGTVVATVFELGVAYFVTSALLLAAIGQFVPAFRDVSRVRGRGPLAPVPADSARAGDSAAGPETPSAPTAGRYRDFAWVFVSRFLVTTGNSVALFYLFYYLRDHIGHADADTGVLVLTGVYALCVLPVAMVSGTASDRSGRRRVFVAVSSAGVAVACVLMAVAGAFATVVVAAAVLGIAWGTFMAVDQALINQVLPEAEARGRDVGVMNLAVAGPNMASPVLAAMALSFLGGYPGLYLFAAGLSIAGAVAIYRIRTVP